MRRLVIAFLAGAALFGSSCSALEVSTGATTTAPAADSGAVTEETAAAPEGEETTTTTEAPDADTTTTTMFNRLVPIPDEPPPFEEVTITTEDGVDIYAKYWAGGPTAVIFTHEYDAAQVGSGGQRPQQSSDTVLTWTSVLAANGHTVLSPDWRGHGQSDGEYNVKESQLDVKAAYEYLVGEGHQHIVMLAMAGSGPVVTDLIGSDPAIQAAGLGLLWSPPQETGFDATRSLPDVETPVWIIGYDSPRLARWPKLLEAKVVNHYGTYVFSQIPTGLQFIDVYGEEFAGRLLDFVESV